MILFSILAFLLIFSTLIIVHEFGHYYAAIKSGVKVEEFGLGMGKKLYGYQRGETEFTLNLIPFGGFVRMLGEEDDSTDPRSFGQAKLWKRMVITLAGVFMNFVMAITFLTILFTVGTDPILVSQADVERAYDNEVIAFSVNGERMTPDEIKALDNPDAPVVFEYLQQTKAPFPQSIWLATTETVRISWAVLEKAAEIPVELIQKQRVPEGLAGPVGIAEVTHKVLPQGFMALVKLTALLSISLAVMNLLTIPALDGGRFVFQIFELILKPLGIKANEKWENYAHMAGFALLMGLLLIITWNDISRIFFA
jgi:regulator of sigma E protease